MNGEIYDVAIVGSGFAGSILARALNAKGKKVLLLEKGRHPRFTLGESSTPLAAFCLERLAKDYALPDLRHLATYGRWSEYLPHLRRGLKRGFTFYHHHRGQPYDNTEANEARLLVAASPEDRLADCHWLRADVDHHLVQAASREGVQYRDCMDLHDVRIDDREVLLLGRRKGTAVQYRARDLVDGSGPAAFLPSRDSSQAIKRMPNRRHLLFAHFRRLPPFAAGIKPALSPGPYPDERAAVHHLLKEGWMYQLPFDHGITSCGLILKGACFAEAFFADPARAWREILDAYPSLATQFAVAEPLEPVEVRRDLGYRWRSAVGERTFLLPHTYCFVDPLFSTGMAWSLLGVERIAHILTYPTPSDGIGADRWLYQEILRREARQIETLIEAAYLAMHDFELFSAIASLYFITVSFAEVEDRLSDPGVFDPAWSGFLGANDSNLPKIFSNTLEKLRALAKAPSLAERGKLLDWLRESLAPWNIAGLNDPTRRNLYPVDLDILVRRAHLLGLDRAQMMAALPRLRGET